MATYVFSKNGMGNYTTGTGMREDMHMQYANILNYQSGVVLTTDLVVTERGAGVNMSVDVSAGRCFIQNSSYSANTANSTKYWGMLSDAVTNLAITTNTSGSTRIDKIVAKIDTTAIANDYATNVGSIIVVAGTPGAGAPATPSNCLLLATITIPTGTTVSINNAMITDSRVYPGLILAAGSPFYLGTAITYSGTDLDLEPSGGDVRLRNGTRLQVFNSGNTESLTMTVGTNTELLITTGNLHIYDTDHDVHLRIYADDAGADYVDIWHDGTNGHLNTGAGDLEILPNGGDVLFKTGTDILIYNSSDTASVELSMGTNFDIVTSSGDITLTPAGAIVNVAGGSTLKILNTAGTQNGSLATGTNFVITNTSGEIQINATTTLRMTSGSNIVLTPTDDVYITAGASLIMRNPADNAETELYTDAANDYHIDPQANGDVIVLHREPRDNNGSATYQNVFRQTGWGYIQGTGVPNASGSVTFPKAYSSASIRVIISDGGVKTGVSAPTSESDIVGGNAYSFSLSSLSTTGFGVYVEDTTGTNISSTTFAVFHWEAIGSI